LEGLLPREKIGALQQSRQGEHRFVTVKLDDPTLIPDLVAYYEAAMPWWPSRVRPPTVPCSTRRRPATSISASTTRKCAPVGLRGRHFTSARASAATIRSKNRLLSALWTPGVWRIAHGPFTLKVILPGSTPGKFRVESIPPCVGGTSSTVSTGGSPDDETSFPMPAAKFPGFVVEIAPGVDYI
jgi:hypothetical protein